MSVVPSNFIGSTQLNPYITTYEGLIKRVKHMFGYPLVQVEVADEQIVDFINESIEYFSKYAGYTEEYLVFDTKIYKPHTGLQVEKLINSTCAFGIEQSAVNVIDLPADTYYYSKSSVFVTVSSEEQKFLNRSIQGPLLYTPVCLKQTFEYTVSTTAIELSAFNYYTFNSALFRAGSSIDGSINYSATGVIIQNSIDELTPVLLTTNSENIQVVPLTPTTYYIYNSNLYMSGSSTNEILPDTSEPGDLILANITTPEISAYTIHDDVSAVNVSTDTYYVTNNSLWKSSPYYIVDDGRSYVGTKIQTTIQALTPSNITTNKSVEIVNNSQNTYYISRSQLWKSGSIIDGSRSLKGILINNALLEVVVDTFTLNDEIIQAVPVPSHTVYFNGTSLYRSGNTITPLNNGYSEVGTLVQSVVNITDSYSTELSVSIEVVSCSPYVFYTRNGALWKSGAAVQTGGSESGRLIQESISNAEQQSVTAACSVDVVPLEPGSLYLSGSNLMQSIPCDDFDIPSGYSEIGNIVVENITVVQYLLQGHIQCLRISCINTPPSTYYIFNNALCRAGLASPFEGYSYSGNVIQDIISNRALITLTDIHDLVSLPPNTLYISDDTLYCSGSATNQYVAGTSDFGQELASNITINPAITIESVPCINMYYDYDLSSYRKVVDVFTFEQGESTGINTLFTLEQAMAQQIYSSYMIGNFGFDLVTWEVLKGFIDTRNKVLAQKPHFRFDSRTQTLRIIPEPRATESYFGLVGCYLERPIKDLIKERWVYDYTKALAMIAVGNTRGKYSGTGLFGGGTVNGSDLRSQGLTEKENLEKVLITEYRDNNPANFFVG